jgi:hypothetical protein
MENSLSGGGLTYECLSRTDGTWRIAYDGNLLPDNVPCKMDVAYTPVSDMYHSGKHMSLTGFAKAMSEMKWSREYFNNLRSENQCRIEQGGNMTGSLVLNGKKKVLNMKSIRDHSWGKRTWAFINRYIWTVLSFDAPLPLKAGQAEYMVYSIADYGTTFKNVVTGWIAGKDFVLPIRAASDLRPLADDGNIPEEFTLYCRPRGEKGFSIKVNRKPPQHTWFMQNKTFRVCEAWCSVEINGITGIGMSELGWSETYLNRKD